MGKFWNFLRAVCVILSAVFFSLKVSNIINWSWWLVFLPIISYVSSILVIILIVFLIVVFTPDTVEIDNEGINRLDDGE